MVAGYTYDLHQDLANKAGRLDRSTDQKVVPQREITTIKSGMMNATMVRVSIEHKCHPNSAAMLHGIEVPHTLCVLPMR